MKQLTRIFGVLVPTFFTVNGGVSLSEVSRIQAENKQLNDYFWSTMSEAVTGMFRKIVTFVGAGESSRTITGTVVTTDQIEEFRGVADRNAQTSVLMHALKVHKRLQAQLQSMDLMAFVTDELPWEPRPPQKPQMATDCPTEYFMELSNIDEMIAALKSPVLAHFGLPFWVTANQLNSRAAVLGKLLSEEKSLFRELVRALPKGGEQLVQTGVIITSWERAYSEDDQLALRTLREQLQYEYNDLQRSLNGCRKRIKDAVRAYNLEEERRYQTELAEYRMSATQYSLRMEQLRSAAETLRQEALAELAGLKVRTE